MSKIVPAYALAHAAPEFFASLSSADWALLPHLDEMWLRPEQHIPAHDWRYLGFICGRGWGKSTAIAHYINGRVQQGKASHIALMAPTEPRAEEVQIKFLIDVAPPWFKPERHRGGLVWPNGVRAVVFTPEAPGRPRSENIELSWLCEIVDWQESTRLDAFENITTATRVGSAQVIWDTTSKGRNDIIKKLLDLNTANPEQYPIQRGTMFDNYLLPNKYLRSVCAQYTGRRYAEEVLGQVFQESDGALWQQAWIDEHRVSAPPPLELTLVSVDPSLSDHKTADECGIIVGGRALNSHAYVLDDLTARMTPEQWGDVVINAVDKYNAAGVLIERNHLGDHGTFVLKSRAETKGYTVRVLPRSENHKRFPARTPGVIYVRENVASRKKEARAEGPACETEAGRIHVVGSLPYLEQEWTTYAGEGKSPNRYDAAAYLISELRDLNREAPAMKAEALTAANKELVQRVASISVGRSVGL